MPGFQIRLRIPGDGTIQMQGSLCIKIGEDLHLLGLPIVERTLLERRRWACKSRLPAGERFLLLSLVQAQCKLRIEVGHKHVRQAAKAVPKTCRGLDRERTLMIAAMNRAIGAIPCARLLHLGKGLQVVPGDEKEVIPIRSASMGK